MKKLLASFFAVSLLMLLFLPLSAAALSEGDYTYTVSDGEAVITGYTGSETELIIPSELGGFPVTGIRKEAFSNDRSLISVVIPNSITSIEAKAFSGCSSLASVTIPDSITSIGAETFSGCSSLTSVTIPDSVTTIGDYAFSGCSSLTSVTIPDRATNIGGYAFRDCGSLASVSGLGSETHVREGLFYNCVSLKSVALPHDVTTIELSAFGNCTSLTSVTIPERVQYIDSWAFKGCSNLASVTIPDGVISIGDWAFDKSVQICCKPNSCAEAFAKNNGNAIYYLVDAPKITAHPKTVSANVGATASFAVTAAGTRLTYQWQVSKDGGSTWANTTISGNKTKTLSFAASASFNGYLFRCAVKDINGKKLTSSAAKLTIAPKITAQPKAVSANVGSTAKFTVTATGAGLTYQWQVSKNGGSSWANTTISGNKTKALSFAASASFNGYLFRCVVKDVNKKSLTSSAAKLTIAPKITAQPKAQSPTVGKTATFTVTATGVDLTYQWQVSKDGGSTWANTTISGNRTKTLSFAASASFNGYLFRCIVRDANGKNLTSNAVRFTVAPKITAQPKAVSTNVSTTAKFTVTATGVGLTYQWQVSKDSGNTWANTTISGNKTKTLSFNASASFNGYLFRCAVKDTNGKKLTTSAVKLTITPKIVTQPTAASVTAGNTASFTVKATGAGLRYQWQVSKDNGITYTDIASAGYNEATFRFRATASFNGYRYRCIITDANGKKLTSAAVSLTVKIGTVYWTAGGSVYHSVRDCPSLSRSSSIYSGTVSQSGKTRGCSKCC